MTTAPMCPTHKCQLEAKATKYGTRFGCTYPGCTVVQWDGSTSTPADEETRTLQSRCHATFDPMWKMRKGPFSGGSAGPQNRRRRAYAWLATTMGVEADKAHFGMFDAEQCRRALAAMESLTAKPVGGAS